MSILKCPPNLELISFTKERKETFEETPLSLFLSEQYLTKKEIFDTVAFLLSQNVKIYYEDLVDAKELENPDVLTILLLQQNFVKDQFEKVAKKELGKLFFKNKYKFIKKNCRKKKFLIREYNHVEHDHFPKLYNKFVVFWLWIVDKNFPNLKNCGVELYLDKILPFLNEYEIMFFFDPKNKREIKKIRILNEKKNEKIENSKRKAEYGYYGYKSTVNPSVNKNVSVFQKNNKNSNKKENQSTRIKAINYKLKANSAWKKRLKNVKARTDSSRISTKKSPKIKKIQNSKKSPRSESLRTKKREAIKTNTVLIQFSI